MSPDSQDLARIVEFGEAEAYADLYRATPPDYAAQYGIEVHQSDSAFVFTASAFDIPLFNRVVGLGLGEPATESRIDAALAHYGARGVKHFAFHLSPVAMPPALTGWLGARGLRHANNWVKMFRGPEPPPAVNTDLRIERIGPDSAAAFSAIAATAFGMPSFVRPWLTPIIGREGWRHYLAFDGQHPVGCGALFIKDRIGWLGIAGTLPESRGRGAQGGIMARRIRDAIEAGCEWIITETGEETADRPNPSYRNMARMGFRLAYARANYMSGHS